MQDKFKHTLRQSGRSVTTARLLLFEYLQQRGTVPVKQFLDDNLAIADRASLYRTLLLFKDIGVIEERLARGQRVVELTDTYDSHHHHLTCMRCGKATVITMPRLEQELAAECQRADFKVIRHTIEADGICRRCQRTEANAPTLPAF